MNQLIEIAYSMTNEIQIEKFTVKQLYELLFQWEQQFETHVEDKYPKVNWSNLWQNL